MLEFIFFCAFGYLLFWSFQKEKAYTDRLRQEQHKARNKKLLEEQKRWTPKRKQTPEEYLRSQGYSIGPRGGVYRYSKTGRSKIYL